jgi:hypothetical protein
MGRKSRAKALAKTTVGVEVSAVNVERYVGGPDRATRFVKALGIDRQGYSEADIADFQAVAVRASQMVNYEQRRMIRSLMGQELSPAEGAAAIRAVMGWQNEQVDNDPAV